MLLQKNWIKEKEENWIKSKLFWEKEEKFGSVSVLGWLIGFFWCEKFLKVFFLEILWKLFQEFAEDFYGNFDILIVKIEKKDFLNAKHLKVF